MIFFKYSVSSQHNTRALLSSRHCSPAGTALQQQPPEEPSAGHAGQAERTLARGNAPRYGGQAMASLNWTTCGCASLSCKQQQVAARPFHEAAKKPRDGRWGREERMGGSRCGLSRMLCLPSTPALLSHMACNLSLQVLLHSQAPAGARFIARESGVVARLPCSQLLPAAPPLRCQSSVQPPLSNLSNPSHPTCSHSTNLICAAAERAERVEVLQCWAAAAKRLSSPSGSACSLGSRSTCSSNSPCSPPRAPLCLCFGPAPPSSIELARCPGGLHPQLHTWGGLPGGSAALCVPLQRVFPMCSAQGLAIAH